MTTTAKAPKFQRPKRDASAISSGKKLLDTARLCDFLSISDDSIATLRADPDEAFPEPVEIVKGKLHWALEDVERYVERKQKRAKQGDRR
jgi:predicted DNA-binding transcriptional regulator AlpA